MGDMKDLTAILLTLNKVPEQWAAYHKRIVMEAIGDYPLITISKKPMDWGRNVIQTEPEGKSNIYWQILKGAKLAATPYIAIIEDDCLYPKDHFNVFRPPMDSFAYNMNRWGIFTWGHPIYFYKPRMANCTMIAPRELAVDALEERFRKYPDGLPEHRVGELGRKKNEKILGVTVRRCVEFYANFSVVCFNHDYSHDHLQRTHRKRPWPVKAYDIPTWGRAEDLVKKFA